RVAGRRPELFRDMWGERREQDEQGLDRLADRRKIGFCLHLLGVDLIEPVHELHQRRDGCVELELPLDIVCDLLDGFMREPSDGDRIATRPRARSYGSRRRALRNLLTTDERSQLVNEPPDAAQE